MPGSFGFNSKRINSTNRPITLGGMLVNQNANGPSSIKRLYYWNKAHNPNNNVFEAIFGINYGHWAPPSTPLSQYHPYYSVNMYLAKV